jgi:iron complex transport system substrate-binding protein
VSVRPFAAAAILALFAFAHPDRAEARARNDLRVVALVPSLVEDLCAIGAARQLAGVSSSTRDIACAKGVPIVGDFATVDVEKIVALHADVVVGIPAQAHLLDPLRRAGVRVELLDDDSYASIFGDIAALGRLTGREARASALNASLRAQTARLIAKRHFKRTPSVFVALGTGPIYTCGPRSYIATLIAMAGGKNAVTWLPGAYGEYSAEALLRLQPDAIVTDPSVGLGAVAGREPWRSLRAVRAHHILTLADAALLERPGPRYNEGLRWLIERLAPLAK